jgi:glutaredoxin-like YruB-family protein
MRLRTVLALIVVILTCSFAGAEMYQWVDENGVVTFKDTPAPASGKRKKVKVYTDDDFDPAPPRQAAPAPRNGRSGVKVASQPSAPRQERFTGTVEIYVTEWCGYCKQAQEYMKSRGIPFVAYDIEKDSDARERHKDLGGRGVPLIIIGSKKMSGFSPAALEQYLNNSR